MNITTLTSQQTTAVELMLNFATKQTEQRMFLLEGFAGTGKSTVWWDFYSELIKIKQSYFVAACASTNKAVSVLEKMAPPGAKNRVEFATLHSLLGLVSQIDKDGHETFKPDWKRDKKVAFSAFDIVLVDEASMVNQELWELTQEAMGRYPDVKIIFMGDSAQLPPVGETISPVFANVSNRYCLTQIVRYVAEKPIGRLVGLVRDWITGINQPQSFQHAVNVIGLDSQWHHSEDNRVHNLADSAWIEKAIALFKSSGYQDDPDFVRCICWTNKVVENLNSRIRHAIYGDTSTPFVEGERLICTKPVFLNGDLVLANSTELAVISCTPDCQHDYKGYELRVNETQTGCGYTLFVLDESALEKWQARCGVLKTQAIRGNKLATRSETWKTYHAHININAPVTYAYALTAHRSQGSTFDNVFADCGNINKNKNVLERHKCLYVALTRAKSNLYLCGV